MSRHHPSATSEARRPNSWLRTGIVSLPSFIVRAALLFTLILPTSSVILATEGNGDSPALRVFETFQSEIAAAVSDARLAGEVAAKAEDLRLDLQRDLIRIEAEIDVLRLDVQRFSGDRQHEAINLLIREVARREKRIYDQIQRLEALAGMPVCLPVETADGEPQNQPVRLNMSWEPEEFVDDVKP